ncbi:MAG: hypothetical protein ACXU8S_06170 [Phenylobacterium sp.]
MSETRAALGRFLGGALRVVAVMLIAYAGLCACFMAASTPGDEFRDPNGWSQVLIVFPIGLALWFGGSWLVRRNRPGPAPGPKPLGPSEP